MPPLALMLTLPLGTALGQLGAPPRPSAPQIVACLQPLGPQEPGMSSRSARA